MTAARVRPSWPGVIHAYADRISLPDGARVVTLQEGGTPLIEAHHVSERTGCRVFLKVEGANPTGSFKDRGMTVAVSKAVEAGNSGVPPSCKVMILALGGKEIRSG